MPLGNGAKLIFKVDAQNLGNQLAARARDADALHVLFRQEVVKLLQQVEGGLDGASLQTPVAREHQRAAGKGTGIREGGRIKGLGFLREGAETRSVVRPANGRKLQTYRADVQTDSLGFLREGAKTRSVVRPANGRRASNFTCADVQTDVDAHKFRCQCQVKSRCEVSGFGCQEKFELQQGCLF